MTTAVKHSKKDYKLLRRQGYELSFKRYKGTRGPGRWFKKYEGKVIYFGSAPSLTNRAAYHAARRVRRVSDYRVDACRWQRGQQRESIPAV
jgi:hypothetical protein